MYSQAISHYRILKKLGEGGMGEVYLAEDTRLHRKVAIKVLPAKSTADPQARKRLLREAQAAATLDHPNICAIHEVGEDGDNSFIVMQYVEGETLAERIKNRGLTLSESIDIAMQVADALAQAHAHGIVHRDIKPSNIIINARHQVKVLDFGLAKIAPVNDADLFEGETISALTGAGMILGTAGYMSPEQARSAKVDTRSDIFSLGTMLYECVTGHRAFTGATFMEICAQILHVNPTAPSQLDARVPQELDRIILRAIEKRPEMRYQTADALLTELKAAREHFNTASNDELIKTQPAAHRIDTSRIFAWKTLAEVARRPRFKLIAACFLAIAVSLFAIWGLMKLLPPAAHQPSAEAQRWYNEGLNAIGDGAYHTARKRLELAIQTDNKFALAHARLAEAWNELDYSDKANEHLLKALTLIQDYSPLSATDALYVKAINYSLIRNFSEAINQYQDILKKSPENQKHLAYFDLGRTYEKNEDIKNAIASYEEALKNTPRYAGALLRLGVLYGRGTDVGLAEAKFKEAESIYEASNNPDGVTESLFLRGYFYNNKSKFAEAKDLLQQALKRAQTFSNKSQQIKILLHLSNIFTKEGNTSEGQKIANDAVTLAQEEGLENLLAEGLIDIGNTFASRGEIKEAENYYKQSLQIAQAYNGHLYQARSRLSLANLLAQRGDADEAINQAEQAIGFYEKGGYQKEFSSGLLIMGRAKRFKGDFAGALEIFKQQLEVAKALNDLAQLSSVYSSIGTLYFYQENYAEALAAYKSGHEINLSIKQPLLIGYSFMNLANMNWRLGNYETAQEFFKQSISLAQTEDKNFKQLVAWVHLYQARMLLSERKFSEVVNESQQSLDWAGTEFKDIAVQAKHTLGLTQVLLGKKQEGLKLCIEAENLTGGLNSPRILAGTRLALAEALWETRDTQAALEKSQKALEDFERLGEQDSEWRALTISALAYQREGNAAAARDTASRAMDKLSILEKAWGAETSNHFPDRADVRHYREQLTRILEALR